MFAPLVITDDKRGDDSVSVLTGIMYERGGLGCCCCLREERDDRLWRTSKREDKDCPSIVPGKEAEGWGQGQWIAFWGGGQMKEFSLLNEASHQLWHEGGCMSFEIREAMKKIFKCIKRNALAPHIAWGFCLRSVAMALTSW